MSEFDQLTDTIDNTISTQLSSVNSWTNIPGSLSKVSSSLAGYVWGFSNSKLFKCQIPCSGNWQEVTLSNQTIIDLTTDESNVYVLTIDGVVHIGSASGQSEFTTVKSPITASSVFVTHTYLWIQSGKGEKRKCAKPCTTPNWIEVPKDTVLITSANDTALFGKDVSGKLYKSDEHLQSGWSEIPKITQTTILNGDDSGIYGIDTNQHLIFCSGENCNPIDTSGHIPASVSRTKNDMWMTTQEPADKGNVFWKLENPDYTSIMNTLTPLDKRRTDIVQEIQQEQKQQDMVSQVQEKVNQIKDFLTKVFQDLGKTKEASDSSIKKLQKNIDETQGEYSSITSVQPVLEKLFLTILAVGLLYLVFGFAGPVVHFAALVILGVGFYLSIT